MDGTRRESAENISMEVMDFGVVQEIDSTAPLDTILKNLLARERFSKAYKWYQNVLVQRRKEPHLSTNLHYLVPGHPLKFFKDNWNGELNTGYFEPFQYKSTKPKIISQMRNIGKTDPVTNYMQIKTEWKNSLVGLRKSINKVRVTSKKKKIQQMNDEVIQCPKNIIDLAAKLETDPDPNFDSSYNWYYAGNGNMHLVCINWVDYLLHSDLNYLYLTRLHKDDMTLERENEASFDCKDDNNILETIYNSSQNVVALRTMKKIIILKIIEIDSHLYFDTLKQFESETAFTSISFDKYHTNILYATRLDGNLSIVNLDRMKGRSVKLKRNCDSNVNNWNSVIGGERGTFMHIEGSTISFYDKRTNSAINSWSGLKGIVDEFHCSDISAATRCDDSPSLYFTTNHNLFLLDTRCGCGTKPRAAQRWAHGLQCAPTYISIGKTDNNKEFIVTSSQWCKDVCVVSNYADSVMKTCDIPGVSMPYHPPHIMDTLTEARMQLLCLDLNDPIDGRLATSTTGLVVTDQGENFAILTHNAFGDIMLRTLYPEYMESFVEDDSVQKLNDWSLGYKTEKKQLEVSSVTDIACIWKKLRSVPDSYEFGLKTRREVFIEREIYEAFENAELIPELLDAWTDGRDAEAPAGEESSLALNLHYDDSDEE